MDSIMLGYTGSYRDSVTGGYSLGNGYRMYLPELMRFTAPDDWSPFGAGGINSYVYCNGDPINHADPSGHMNWLAWTTFGIGAALTVGSIFLPFLAPEAEVSIEGAIALSTFDTEVDTSVGATTAVTSTVRTMGSESEAAVDSADAWAPSKVRFADKVKVRNIPIEKGPPFQKTFGNFPYQDELNDPFPARGTIKEQAEDLLDKAQGRLNDARGKLGEMRNLSMGRRDIQEIEFIRNWGGKEVRTELTAEARANEYDSSIRTSKAALLKNMEVATSYWLDAKNLIENVGEGDQEINYLRNRIREFGHMSRQILNDLL